VADEVPRKRPSLRHPGSYVPVPEDESAGHLRTRRPIPDVPLGTDSYIDRAGNYVTRQQAAEPWWHELAALADREVGLVAVDDYEDPEDALKTGPGEIWTHGIELFVGALAPIVAVYSKAFLENIANRNADAAVEVASHMRRRWRARKGRVRRHDSSEVRIDFNGTSYAAAIIVTENMPDEALLAILELDISAETVQGKVLRWDDARMSWVPDANEEQ